MLIGTLVLDPIMVVIVAATLAVVVIGVTLKYAGQPRVVAYIAAGILVGPWGFGVVDDTDAVARFGDIGVVVLMFFVGMEVHLPRLVANWRVSFVGVLLIIVVTVGANALVAVILDWPVERALLLGFAISLSSTAVVVALLRERAGGVGSPIGNDAIGMVIVQDMALAPLAVVVSLMGDQQPTTLSTTLQITGGVVVIAVVALLVKRENINLPFQRLISDDPELQVFAAGLLCFGIAALTAWLELSAALGAFVAGLIVASARATDWVHRSLEPLRVILVAGFFVSIGMLVDLDFLADEWPLVLALVASVFIFNTLVIALVLRLVGRSWEHALAVGALLAQVGEFSFVLAAMGRDFGLVDYTPHKAIVATIALTMALSPAWIALVHRIVPMLPNDPKVTPTGKRTRVGSGSA